MNVERPIEEAAITQSRVVTLAFLSKHLPASFLGEETARWLRRETGASVVLVRIKPCAASATARDTQPVDLIPGCDLQLPRHLPESETGCHFLNLGVSGEPPAPEWTASLVDELRRRFSYVLFAVNTDELPASTLFEFLRRSDSDYLFLRAATGDVYQLDLLAREFQTQSNDVAARITPVLCLAGGEAVAGYDELIQQVAGPVHIFIRGCPKLNGDDRAAGQVNPTGSFQADVRRLAREIGSCLVGLALSSGAAKSLAHIGVIQVLEENNISVDVVAGSSMGAYVGALWASGLEGQQLEKLARELEARFAMCSLIDPAFPPRQGFLRGFAVKNRLKKSIGEIRFAELLRPLRVVATNLETLERKVFSSGEVATAVHASIAVPGICVPVAIGEETCIDGGIVDPLPVDVLREMGVDRVIAVNTIPTPARIRYCLQAEHEMARLPKKRARELIRKLNLVDTHMNYFARGNILEILMRSVHGGQIYLAESLGRRADIVLRPEICDDRWVDFRNPGKYIALGRKIAGRHLQEIKLLVERKAESRERQPTLASLATVA
jgi:NTE family protein